MNKPNIYLGAMKDKDQIVRLDIKTDREAIIERARWCGNPLTSDVLTAAI